MVGNRRIVIPLFVFLVASLAAQAEGSLLVFRHQGNVDPLSEGWVLDPTHPGPGVVVGPISDGEGPAWMVDDNSSEYNSGCMYQGLLSPDDLQHAAAGWILRLNLRLPDLPESPGGSPTACVYDGERRFQLHFGCEVDGDPEVRLIISPTYITAILPDAGPGYHLYELQYDPDLDTTSLRIDGTLVFLGYPGYAYATPPAMVSWGAGSSGDTGQGDFALVEFHVSELIPAESTSWSDVKALY